MWINWSIFFFFFFRAVGIEIRRDNRFLFTLGRALAIFVWFRRNCSNGKSSTNYRSTFRTGEGDKFLIITNLKNSGYSIILYQDGL